MIGAFILSTGQSTELDAVKSINYQVTRLEVIYNVKPVNKAINKCFKLAKEYGMDYFLIMGADTIHYRDSLRKMIQYMKEDLWCVMGRLNDYYRGPDSYGNHLYNRKAIGSYRVKVNDPLYDHKIHADMEKKGYKKAITNEVIGTHHPIWTPKEAFEKHLFSGARYEEPDRKIYYEQVKKRYDENPCEVNRAALLGYEMGMKKERLNPLSFETTKEWEKVKDLFNNKEKLVW